MAHRNYCRLAPALGLLVSVGAPSSTAGEAISRVSLAVSGNPGEYGGGASAVSADGRYVAFESYAADLVGGDTNRTWDVFLRDIQTGATQRVSVSGSYAQGNAPSHGPAIGVDGRYVAFWSSASNLVANDTNNAWDVFVRDMQEGTTQRVSLSVYGAQGAGDAEADRGLSISADGMRVAFRSAASNLVSGDTNAVADIFVRDVTASTTTRVSVTAAGAQANGASADPAISADGAFVAFSSFATNLVTNDTNAASDVFVRNLQTGATTRVSVAANGAQSNGYSYQPAVSENGRYVAFESYASNLVAGDTNNTGDIFVRDTQTGTTQRVSVAADGSAANGPSLKARISADGRRVVFVSFASNLTADGSDAVWSVFLRDLETQTTTRITLPPEDDAPAPASDLPAISADGGFVAFQSHAAVPFGDAAIDRYDVFLRDLSVPIEPPLTMADAADAFHIAAGLAPATPADIRRLNVDGLDAAIGMEDALRIARRAAGL
jgi:hypothetical protein